MMQKDAPLDYKSIQTTAKNKAKADFEKNPFKYTEEQIKVYTTIGGTAFLDENYTVFGEVIDGFDVIDKIAAVKTLPGDRPEKDIKFSIKIY
jgi:cyclophilin family peptidyl-prolyl cis-trans isomerase